MTEDEPEPKSIYIGQWEPGEHYLVIAAPDGSFRRWPLNLRQIKKLAREAFDIAIKA